MESLDLSSPEFIHVSQALSLVCPSRVLQSKSLGHNGNWHLPHAALPHRYTCQQTAVATPMLNVDFFFIHLLLEDFTL